MQNQAITDYIAKLDQPWQAEIATRLRQLVHEGLPEGEERLQYSKPHFMKGKQYAAVIGTAKGWVSFTIFNAQDITPPKGLFEQSDDGSRKTIKIKPGQQVDYDLIAALFKQAADALA